MRKQLDYIVSGNRRYFDAQAEEYARNARLYRPRMYSLLIEHFLWRLSPEKPLPILEIGPGAGLYVEASLRAGFRYVAFDLSAQMLGQLHTSIKTQQPDALSRLELVPGDVRNLSALAGRSFQAIIIQAVIHLFPKEVAERITKNLAAHLMPGGHMWISTTIGATPQQGFFVDANPKRPADLVGGVSSYRAFYTRDEFHDLAHRSGLIVLREVENIDAERDHKRHWLTLVGQKAW